MNDLDFIISTFTVDRSRLEFLGHPEYELHPIGEKCDWGSFRHVLEQVSQKDEDDAIVICHEGHRFTEEYQSFSFFRVLMESVELGTEMLLGGCRDFGNLVPVKPGLYWVDKYEDCNFFVLFRRAYQTLLNLSLNDSESLDEVLSRVLSNKLLIAPFISWTGTKCRADSQLALYDYIINKYHITGK
jgi:hypothetical protein